MPLRTHASDLSIFDPISVSGKILKNRLAHTPTVTNLGCDGSPTQEQIKYYERIARGGVGLIITEGMSIHRTSHPNDHIVRLHDPKSWEGLKSLAEAVRKYDVKILPQLWHVGRQQLWGPKVAPWGVSYSADPFSGVSPHVMSEDEIYEIQDAYIASASKIYELGFDGIELHGAHGYLITQFLSPWTNRRSDKFGGSFENRIRFVREITSRVRKEAGKDFILGIRLDGSEFVKGGLTIEDTEKIVDYLTGNRMVDLIDVGEGNFSLSLETHVPDMHFPEAPYLNIITRMRLASKGIPIIATGRIVNRDVAEDIVSSGQADIVGMSRALLSDQDLPLKWSGSISTRLRNCISCNVCWDNVQKGRKIACIHNPELLADSAIHDLKPSAKRMTINVIGGGPAGMEAAWVAASKGHDVTLWESANTLGGQLINLSQMGGLSGYGSIIEYQKEQLTSYSVSVKKGVKMSSEEIENLDGDLVVLATGSYPIIPEIEMNFTRLIFPSDSDLLRIGEGRGIRALIFDENGGYYAYGPMELLTSLGYSVTLVSSRVELGSRLDYLSKIGLHRRLRENGVCVHLGFQVSEVTPDNVTIQDLYTSKRKEIGPFDLVVWAGERASNDLAFSMALTGKRNFKVIGDAYSPRDIMSAIHEGHSAADP